mmetsp:Transcript_101596/g.286502  ORF Transcript_101596/g.286502 Transcript_101596/m.286502 type:complete len:103 (+) Transcript_101596:329-637(+)
MHGRRPPGDGLRLLRPAAAIHWPLVLPQLELELGQGNAQALVEAAGERHLWRPRALSRTLSVQPTRFAVALMAKPAMRPFAGSLAWTLPQAWTSRSLSLFDS